MGAKTERKCLINVSGERCADFNGAELDQSASLR